MSFRAGFIADFMSLTRFTMKILMFFLLIFLMFFRTTAQDRITGYNFATRSEVIARNGMACTSYLLAKHAAIGFLKAGGVWIPAGL